jgi:hypothetical protein
MPACRTCLCDPCTRGCPPPPKLPLREHVRRWLSAVANAEEKRRAYEASTRGGEASPGHRERLALDLARSQERRALDDMRAAAAEAFETAARP